MRSTWFDMAPTSMTPHTRSSRTLRLAILAALPAALLFTTTSASAQTQDDRFVLRLSAFNPEASLRFSGDAALVTGDESGNATFAETLSTGSEWRPRGAIGFRISDRQALVGNYYDYRRDDSRSYGGGILNPADYGLSGDPVDIPEVNLDGRLKFSLASLNYEYSVVRTDRFQWGLGLGVTYAELDAGVAGNTPGTPDVAPESGEVAWKRSGLSPGVHTRLAWTPSERWHVGLEGQYVDTNWGDFTDERGHFERGGIIVEYMISERLGVHVGYDWFRLKLADDYRGSLEAPAETGVGTVEYSGKLTGQLKTHGPMAGLTFKF